MRAYAVAWVHPDRKLSTRVDAHGRNNPTWNDKFVFRVDDEFLHNDTSAVMIDIYALHWFRDIHVGTVRVLVGNLINPPAKRHHHHRQFQLGMRFVALQVRRASGRPQGILNIGVALLDSSMRSMPLYTQVSSAVGYRHLMGEEDAYQRQHNNVNSSTTSNNQLSFPFIGKPELRRTKSDTSSMIGSEMMKKSKVKSNKNGKPSSMVSGSEAEPPVEFKRKKSKKGGGSKASSMLSGSDFFKRGNKGSGSVVNGSDINKDSGKTAKSSSVVNSSEVMDPPKKGKIVKSRSSVSGSDGSDPPQRKGDTKDKEKSKHNNGGSPYKPYSPSKGFAYDAKNFKNYKNGPIITESELGPSPSEVAAAVAKEKLQRKVDPDDESSVMMPGWDMDSSIEGLQSKLERWRAELPPLYDSTGYTSSSAAGGVGNLTSVRHSRRHTEGNNGLFSCFSNICGCECSIVCGSGGPNSPKQKGKKKGTSGRLVRSPSLNDFSYL